MIANLSAAAAADPPSTLALPTLELQALGFWLLALVLAGCFASLRRSMLLSVEVRVLARVQRKAARERLKRALGHLGQLSISAHVLELASSVAFVLATVRVLAGPRAPVLGELLVAVAACTPALWIITQAVAPAVALRFGDSILVHTLSIYRAAHAPVAGLAWAFEHLRGACLRLFGVRDNVADTREIVADLQDVIADAAVSGQLDQTEREIIGNVMEVRDVDVAAVMTPRTEIQGVEVGASLVETARLASESGFSRLPVYDGKLDTIIGTITARDIVSVLAAGRIEETNLRDVLHQAYFVPETKHVSELLAEFRKRKTKLAVVLDEYGGTAGIVTLSDILEEIVGELQDEWDEDEPEPVRRLPGGACEVQASLHVSELNEVLGLNIPEEEAYETVGGFVLAEFGYFPEKGEIFTHDNTEFAVLEANDRRVLKVRVRPATPA